MSHFDSMVIFAARYAHSRNTGAALAVVNYALENWEEMTEQGRKQLVKEAKNEAQFCKEDWHRLIDKMTLEQTGHENDRT